MVRLLKQWYKRMVWPNHFALDYLARGFKSKWRARMFYFRYEALKFFGRRKAARAKKNPNFYPAVGVIESAMSSKHPLILVYKKYLPMMDANRKPGVFRRVKNEAQANK